MEDQIINTGDPATDREIVDEMKSSCEAAGMSVQVTPHPGGGYRVQVAMPGAWTAAPQAGAPAQAASMPTPPAGAGELGGEEGAGLVAMARQGNLQETMDFLSQARAAGDWDEYTFMAGHVGAEAPRPLLDQAVTQAPNHPDLRVLRSAQGIKAAWDSRGTGTADTITDESADAMVNFLDIARRDLADAAGMDPPNPAPHAMMIEVATLHENMASSDGRAAFQQALQRHPANLKAFQNALRLSSQKWGGGHDEQLQVARLGLSRAAPGSDLFGCIFYAHMEIWFYKNRFDGDEDAAQAYLANPAVQAELNQVFDRWVTPQYRARRTSPPMLHLAACWYFMTSDIPRLKRAMAAINNVQVAHPWHYIGEPTVMYMEAWQLTL
jgi:hypothetical protein